VYPAKGHVDMTDSALCIYCYCYTYMCVLCSARVHVVMTRHPGTTTQHVLRTNRCPCHVIINS